MQKGLIRKRKISGSAWNFTKCEKKAEINLDLEASLSTDSETEKNQFKDNSEATKKSILDNENALKKWSLVSLNKNMLELENLKFYSPDEIMSKHQSDLSEQEKNEINFYTEIFYWGKGIEKLNEDICDDDGYYKGIIGDHIAYRYEILSVLGVGTFSVVFECKDHKLGQLYAVKVLRNSPDYKASGKLEIEILSTLKDSKNPEKGINLIVDHFEFRGHLCIVLEKLCKSLHDYQEKLPERRVPTSTVREITVQLIKSVNFMHNLKLIHCDLKPDNIMLKNENTSEVTIIDFNSTCKASRKTADYIQSRPYRAPEVVLDMNYSEKIDMWSIGCIVLELILGFSVFECDNERELFKRFIEVCGFPNRGFVSKGRRSGLFVDRLGKFKVKAVPKVCEIRKILEGNDPLMIDFVEKLMRWEPEDRMSSFDSLKHEWIEGFSILGK
jgi:dual specificity tyrosine-phosphorylation-regulated kinase 2/3/4